MGPSLACACSARIYLRKSTHHGSKVLQGLGWKKMGKPLRLRPAKGDLSFQFKMTEWKDMCSSPPARAVAEQSSTGGHWNPRKQNKTKKRPAQEKKFQKFPNLFSLDMFLDNHSADLKGSFFFFFLIFEPLVHDL